MAQSFPRCRAAYLRFRPVYNTSCWLAQFHSWFDDDGRTRRTVENVIFQWPTTNFQLHSMTTSVIGRRYCEIPAIAVIWLTYFQSRQFSGSERTHVSQSSIQVEVAIKREPGKLKYLCPIHVNLVICQFTFSTASNGGLGACILLSVIYTHSPANCHIDSESETSGPGIRRVDFMAAERPCERN